MRSLSNQALGTTALSITTAVTLGWLWSGGESERLLPPSFATSEAVTNIVEAKVATGRAPSTDPTGFRDLIAATETDEGPAPTEVLVDEPGKTGLLPLSIRLLGPAEWVAGQPVALVWPVHPVSGRAAEAKLVTDGEGVAVARLDSARSSLERCSVDLGFPTLGAVVTPLPPQGGEVEIGTVVTSRLDLTVTNDGAAPTEPTELWVRVPAARTPANRWHRFRSVDGQFSITAEAAIDLEVQVRFESGHLETHTIRTGDPEEVTTHEVACSSGYATTVQLLDEFGRPMTDTETTLSLVRPTRSDEIGTIVTDDTGCAVIRLPFTDALHRVRVDARRPDATAHATVARVEFETTPRDADGFRTLRLSGASGTIRGRVVDDEEAPRAGVTVRVGTYRSIVVPKSGERIDDVWTPLQSATTDADGRFVLPVFADASEAISLIVGRRGRVVLHDVPLDTDQQVVLPQPARSAQASRRFGLGRID